MQTQVTLTEHKPQSMNGQNGPWTLHKFKASDGQWYEVSKTDLANTAYALMQSGTPVLIEYDQKQNGQYTNNRVTNVQALGAGGAPMAPGVVPNATNGPVQTATAPTKAPAASSSSSTYRPTAPEDAARMSRSKGIDQALKAAELGIVELSSIDQLFDVAGTFARYAFSGSRPGGGAVQGAVSSGAGGGEGQGAPQQQAVAPAAAEAPQPAPAPATAPATADDDIPF